MISWPIPPAMGRKHPKGPAIMPTELRTIPPIALEGNAVHPHSNMKQFIYFSQCWFQSHRSRRNITLLTKSNADCRSQRSRSVIDSVSKK
jgi:hypothetical protein